MALSLPTLAWSSRPPGTVCCDYHKSKLRAAAGLASHIAGVIVQDRLTVTLGDGARKFSANELPRAHFLKLMTLAGGAAAAGAAPVEGSPDVASADGRSPKQDRAILNFLSQLEAIQAAFYKDG